MSTLNRLAVASRFSQIAGGSHTPSARLGETIAALAAAVALATVAVPARLAIAQSQVIPLLVADPSGPDLGPVDLQTGFQVAVSRAPLDVAATVTYRFFNPNSATFLDMNLVGLNGPGGFTTIAQSPANNPDVLFSDVRVNAAREVLFLQSIPGYTTQRYLRLFNRENNLVTVVETGDHVPGLPGSVFGTIYPNALLNDRGECLVYGQIRRSNHDTEIDRGLFLHGATGLEPLVRTGLLAPGLGGARFLFDDGSPVAYRLNNAGQVAVRCAYSTDDPFALGGYGIWVGSTAGFELAAASGDAAPPVFPVGSTLVQVDLIELRDSGVLSAQVLADISTGGQKRAVIAGEPGALVAVLYEGMLLPGTGLPTRVLYPHLGTFSMNDSGDWVSNPYVYILPQLYVAQGVWRSLDGAVRLLALKEQTVAPGIRFGASFSSPVINSRGEAMFVSGMRDDAGASIGNWIWFVNRGGDRRPILRQGDAVTLPSGESRAITSIQASLSGPDPSGWVMISVSLGEASAVLLVNPRPCDGDYNGDGLADPDDLADFITCFFLDIAVPGLCAEADFNSDGFRDPDDLAEFITAFFGCL